MSRRSLEGSQSTDPGNFLVVIYGLTRARLRIVGVQRLRVGACGRQLAERALSVKR